MLAILSPAKRLDFDPAKAKKQLGWEPKVKFKELVAIMVDADLKLAQDEAKIKSALAD